MAKINGILTYFKQGDSSVRTSGPIKYLLLMIEVKGFKEFKILCSWQKWCKIPQGNGCLGAGQNLGEKL